MVESKLDLRTFCGCYSAEVLLVAGEDIFVANAIFPLTMCPIIAALISRYLPGSQVRQKGS